MLQLYWFTHLTHVDIMRQQTPLQTRDSGLATVMPTLKRSTFPHPSSCLPLTFALILYPSSRKHHGYYDLPILAWPCAVRNASHQILVFSLHLWPSTLQRPSIGLFHKCLETALLLEKHRYPASRSARPLWRHCANGAKRTFLSRSASHSRYLRSREELG